MNRRAGTPERYRSGGYINFFRGLKRDIARGYEHAYRKRGQVPPMVSTRAISPLPASWVQSFDKRRAKFTHYTA